MVDMKADPRVTPATANGSGVLTAVANMRPLTQQEKDLSKAPEVKLPAATTPVVPTVPPTVPQDATTKIPEVKLPEVPQDAAGEVGKAPEVDPNKAPEVPVNKTKDYDWNKHATPEFFETGKLSKEAIKELCDTFGLDEKAAEYTALGLSESIRRNTEEVLSAIGGKEVYTELSQWASKALSPEALKQFNADVSTSDVAHAKAAVVALKKQFVEANGSPKVEQQKLMQGTTNVASQGANMAQPFRSIDEFRGAQKDARYRVDSVYTAEVHQRLLLAQRAGYIK